MKNFYLSEVSGFQDSSEVFLGYLSPSKFLESWEKYIYRKAGNLHEGKNFQRLASAIHLLWKRFNVERTELDKEYMENASFVAAYLSSFYLSNIEKTYAFFLRAENRKLVIELLKKEKDVLRVMDFGCGPLSASVGLLFALQEIHQKELFSFSLPKIEIIGIDRSVVVFEAGVKILTDVSSENISVGLVTSPVKVEGKVDFVLAANVMNEIPAKHRLKTYKSLEEKLEDEGLLLILEPGHEAHAKSLGDLRDEILSSSQIQLVGPCVHREKCPLSNQFQKRDWCWTRHTWQPPEFQVELDKKSNLDHREMAYSYLFLQNTPQKDSGGFARVVSDKIAVDFQNERQRIYILANVIEKKQHVVELLDNPFPPPYQKELFCGPVDLQSYYSEALDEASFGLEDMNRTRRGQLIEKKPEEQNGVFVAERKVPRVEKA